MVGDTRLKRADPSDPLTLLKLVAFPSLLKCPLETREKNAAINTSVATYLVREAGYQQFLHGTWWFDLPLKSNRYDFRAVSFKYHLSQGYQNVCVNPCSFVSEANVGTTKRWQENPRTKICSSQNCGATGNRQHGWIERLTEIET